MRILVTGSRNWLRAEAIADALDDYLYANTLNPAPVVIVHGACPKGADLWAHRWAKFMEEYGLNVKEEPHPADWKTHGKQAGFIRNDAMVKTGADVCLAFIRDDSHGATHCKNLALMAGIPVRVFREDASGRYLGEDG